MAIHPEFRWPSTWTRLAAHLDFATAAVTTTGVRSVCLEQRCGDQRICIAEDQRLKSAASGRNPSRAVAMGEDPVSRVFLAWRGLSQGHAAWTDAAACSDTRCRGWVLGVANGSLVLAVAVGGGDGDLSAVLSLSSPLRRTRREALYGREVITVAMEAAAHISNRLRAKETTSLLKGLEDRARQVGPRLDPAWGTGRHRSRCPERYRTLGAE